MKNSFVISPIMLGLITTKHCTAACKNCCFECNPSQKERLSLEEMKNYIDQSIIQYSSIKVVILTGGECFTLGKDLDKIIKYASEKN